MTIKAFNKLNKEEKAKQLIELLRFFNLGCIDDETVSVCQ